MSERDPRLGLKSKTARPQYPQVNVLGEPYTRNGIRTRNLDREIFVVLPTFRSEAIDSRVEAAIAELRPLIVPNAPPIEDVAVKGKGK